MERPTKKYNRTVGNDWIRYEKMDIAGDAVCLKKYI
jgi:hypothetical protein